MSEMTRMTIRAERKVSRMMSVPDVNSFVMQLLFLLQGITNKIIELTVRRILHIERHAAQVHPREAI
jgi:hypothetical protein